MTTAPTTSSIYNIPKFPISNQPYSPSKQLRMKYENNQNAAYITKLEGCMLAATKTNVTSAVVVEPSSIINAISKQVCFN